MTENPHHKKEDASPLYCIPGGKYPRLDKDAHAQYLWQLCKAALWPYEAFTPSEELACSHLLSAHFQGQYNSDGFRDLAERILLASETPINCLPIVYLNIRYNGGFAATEAMHQAIAMQQRTVPLYCYTLSLFSRILYECAQGFQPTMTGRHLEQLSLIRQPRLINLYCHTVILFQLYQTTSQEHGK